jgi:hypothetical protein
LILILNKQLILSMSDLILLHPVRTLDNQELLPAGTQLSAEIINELVSKARSVSYQKHSLLQSGSIRKDILRFINRPPYNVIFSDNEVKDDLLNFMENVHLVTPVIQTLDYFKEMTLIPTTIFSVYSHFVYV